MLYFNFEFFVSFPKWLNMNKNFLFLGFLFAHYKCVLHVKLLYLHIGKIIFNKVNIIYSFFYK